MLNKEILSVLKEYKDIGWVPEPEAKRIFGIYGLKTPAFRWARSIEEALEFAGKNGYPVVAKIVSRDIIHKSDVGGVITGIDSNKKLEEAYRTLSGLKGFEGIVVDEMVLGREIIIGAKVDYQFGPVILIGIGGTGVEIYRDVAMRMAPIDGSDANSMIYSLKGSRLLTGFRGSDSVNMNDLTDILIKFSSLLMELGDKIESIDLNPVMCSKEKCVIADARIMLNKLD